MSKKEPAVVTERRIESVGGVEVCISRQADKPLMLLVRMASRGMGVWDHSWDDLSRHFSVAQFDLKMPSLDEMSKPREAFGRLAKSCVDVAAGLGYDQFHLLGWTGGAHVALCCAADFPRHLKSITLVAPFFRLEERRSLEMATEFMRVLMESGGREIYAYYWFMAGLSPSFVADHFSEIQAWVRARLDGDRFMQFDTAPAMEWIRTLRSFSLTDAELARIEIPSLIVGPELDSAHIGPNARMAEELHQRIPGARLEIAKGLGSLFPIEAPETFRALSHEFFARVSAEGGAGVKPTPSASL